jgi:hypothetical protein
LHTVAPVPQAPIAPADKLEQSEQSSNPLTLETNVKSLSEQVKTTDATVEDQKQESIETTGEDSVAVHNINQENKDSTSQQVEVRYDDEMCESEDVTKELASNTDNSVSAVMGSGSISSSVDLSSEGKNQEQVSSDPEQEFEKTDNETVVSVDVQQEAKTTSIIENMESRVDQVRPWPAKQHPDKKTAFSSGFLLGKKQTTMPGGGFSFSKQTDKTTIIEKPIPTSTSTETGSDAGLFTEPTIAASSQQSPIGSSTTLAKQNTSAQQTENPTSTIKPLASQLSMEEKRLARMQRFTQPADQVSNIGNLKGKRTLSKMKEDSVCEGSGDDKQAVVGKKAKLDSTDDMDEDQNEEEEEE